MTQGLQFYRWDGVRKELATCFRVQKGKREARAYITTHPTAWWELRLDVDGNLIESKAFKEQDPLLETIAEWRARLVAAGQDPPAIEASQGRRGVMGEPIPSVQDSYSDLLKANSGEFNMRLPAITQRAAILNAAVAVAQFVW